jgi:hypothetical protein
MDTTNKKSVQTPPEIQFPLFEGFPYLSVSLLGGFSHIILNYPTIGPWK